MRQHLGKWDVHVHFGGRLAVVVPVHDLKEHDHFNHECWCKPRLMFNCDEDGMTETVQLTHNALDGRE